MTHADARALKDALATLVAYHIRTTGDADSGPVAQAREALARATPADQFNPDLDARMALIEYHLDRAARAAERADAILAKHRPPKEYVFSGAVTPDMLTPGTIEPVQPRGEVIDLGGPSGMTPRASAVLHERLAALRAKDTTE